MSTPSGLREIRPKTDKPHTYLDIPYIKASLDLLDKKHHEADVERFTSFLLNMYFPDADDWSKVPQFLAPEKKKYQTGSLKDLTSPPVLSHR